MTPHSNRDAFCVLFTLVALLPSGVPEARTQDQREAKSLSGQQGNDIREIAFRKLFDLGPKGDVLFIKIDGNDPTSEFLRRFDGYHPSVKGASHARVVRKFPAAEYVQERGTKRRGMIADVGKISWLGDDKVKIDGGYYCGALCSAGYTFYFIRRNEKWLFDFEKLNIIS